MPASPFLAMNRIMQRTFAHHEPLVWHRPGGAPEGYPLKGFFSSVSEGIDAEGFVSASMNPTATLFVDDIIAIDPARSTWKQTEVFRTNGSDTISVGGKTYRIESCRPDGFNKVIVTLTES